MSQPVNDFQYQEIAFADLTESVGLDFRESLLKICQEYIPQLHYQQLREVKVNNDWIYKVKSEWTGANIFANPERTHFTLGESKPTAGIPRIYNLLSQLFDEIDQVTIMKLAPGGMVDWHSHHHITENSEKKVLSLQGYILHFPIVSE
ncbi:MAG: hypothetical protein ACLGGX_12245, partial [Bdellovibrionia bacterium]